MRKPIDFYNNEEQYFLEKYKNIKIKIVWSSIFRLSVFTIVAFLTFSFGNLQTIFTILFFGLVVFLSLIKRHSVLKQESSKLAALIKINQTEIHIIKSNAKSLNTGEEYNNPKHTYSHDIDLFGMGSFFQYINRTTTHSGKHLLANMLTSNDITNIKIKQQAINELSQKAKWRQNFTATANLIHVKIKMKHIVNWIETYVAFLPNMMRYIPSFFLFSSITIAGLILIDIIPNSFLLFWLLFGLAISGIYFKKINKLSALANEAKETFRQYAKLIDKIENTSFQASLLLEKQKVLKNKKRTASKIITNFSKELDALDQRNNMLFAFLANGFALWDIKHSFQIEKWIIQYKDSIEKWFEVVAFFDAQNSLGNYKFNHPEHVFPKITDEKIIINSQELGHPLLDKKNRINNDFRIDTESFFIITGANMAGKSTFLRTVSLSIVMANVGLPVCAKEYSYFPIKLITSMRTSDSLSNDESYFFSELKRLKFVKDAIQKEKHFIVLDEILKGTNSVDKAIGSRKFVERLVASNSTGIIATHDLSLCEISNELKEVKNYYFDAEINNDELSFDYKLKEGVCQNMNASFLLRKMDIV